MDARRLRLLALAEASEKPRKGMTAEEYMTLKLLGGNPEATSEDFGLARPDVPPTLKHLNDSPDREDYSAKDLEAALIALEPEQVPQPETIPPELFQRVSEAIRRRMW